MDKDARIILWKIWAFLSLLTAGFSFFFAVIGILSFLKHPQPGDLPAIILLAAAGIRIPAVQQPPESLLHRFLNTKASRTNQDRHDYIARPGH